MVGPAPTRYAFRAGVGSTCRWNTALSEDRGRGEMCRTRQELVRGHDIGRGAGIYGTSAGGQSAMGALLFHPDFYTAAVSSCA